MAPNPTTTRDPSRHLTRRPPIAEDDRSHRRHVPASDPASIPDLQDTDVYADSASQAVHRFPSSLEALSWESSSIPYFDQPLPSDLSPSMNFNAHNNSGANASLDILNAESYDFGSQDMPNHKSRSRRPRLGEENHTLPFGLTAKSQVDSANSRVSSEEHEGRQRKKARVEVLSDEDDTSKKARGRPRLDTMDKTAADRRRTQIRNAQRAYRSRKETTISSLESQVQELKGTNEEMSNMFLSLYDFAVGKGLLQKEPEFSKRLERCKMLAKASTADESPKDEEPSLVNRGKRRHSESEPSQNQTESATMPATPIANPTSVWGYQISHDGSQISHDDQSPSKEIQQAQESNGLRPSLTSHNRDMTHPQTVPEQVQGNVNFFEMMNGQDMQQYRAEIPSPQSYSQYFPQELLPLPNSYAYAERSFARRLHRETCQTGYKLITAKNPPPKKFEQVFSFTLKYSTKEQIKARFERVLFSSAKETLQAWREPFVHVGGSGTYYPVDECDLHGMPKFRTGLSMGPFQKEVIATRQNLMQDNMRSLIPGFEGEWFDPNDVENYLRGRGINILDDMQYVQVEWEALVAYVTSPPRSVTSTTQTSFSPRTPRSPRAPMTMQSNYLTAIPEDTGAFNTQHGIEFGALTPNSGMTLEPEFSDWNRDYGIHPLNKTPAQDAFNITGPILNVVPIQQTNNNVSPVPDSRVPRTLTLNVNALIDSLTGNGVCLGRTPGFRRADVDVAIYAAIGEAMPT